MPKPKFFDHSLTPSLKVEVMGDKVVARRWFSPSLVKTPVNRSGRCSSGDRPDNHVYRSKNAVRGLAFSNFGVSGCDYFFTVTLGVDGWDYSAFVLAWGRFVRKLKRKFPAVRYLAVPEVQPKSRRWHAHALLFGLPSEYSLFRSFGRQWRRDVFVRMWSDSVGEGRDWHRAEIDKVDSAGGLSWYLAKYVTKDMMTEIPKGRKCYFSGGVGLRWPKVRKFCPRLDFSGRVVDPVLPDIPEIPVWGATSNSRNGFVSVEIFDLDSVKKRMELIFS